MDEFKQFLETFITQDREAEKQREQNYIALIQKIKSELLLIHTHNEYADLEEVD